LGFDETRAGKLGVIVTEAAGNILKHARHGQLILNPIEDRSVGGIEVLALDQGPGMANPARCFADGYSTVGTLGQGLGAIARMASTWDVHSTPGSGTAVLARLWAQELPAAAIESGLDVGVVSLPKAGEESCGDGWAVNHQPGRSLLMLVDGSGHGWHAAEAAREAVRVFRQNVHRRPGAILEAAHAALRGTRGAAMAVLELDLDQHSMRYAGVGNISAVVVSNERRTNLVSHNGIVGHQARKFQEFVYPWQPDGVLIMHSDGLASQWRLEDYAGLAGRDPSLIAGVLYRDHTRGRDDVSVLVARARAQGDAALPY
jgi:anti-sigma regulatory factor (Ser/Thr protein kinase)